MVLEMKRKNTRHILVTIVIISFVAIFLTACGKKVADEEQIKQELELNQEFQFLGVEEQIDELIIEKRQTDKEQKVDKVWCEVKISDAEVACVKKVVLIYGLYDKEGWILDDVEVDSSEDWEITPLVGISREDAINSLYGQNVLIDDEEWEINANNLINVEIESQQTNLEDQKDVLIFDVVIDDKVEKAEGKIQIEYVFDRQWKISDVISTDDFTASMKTEYVLDITEEELIKVVAKKEIPIGMTKQMVSVGDEDIVGFQTNEQREEDKGLQQIYECSYKIEKAHLTINVNAVITYYYEDGTGWNGNVTDISSTIESSNIEGDWSGTYVSAPWDGGAELSISELQADGTVKAVYKFTPHNSNSASYELSGTWDQDSLQLVLEAGAWIVEPEKIRLSNDKSNIIAELDVTEECLEGKAQGGSYFQVMKAAE